MPYNKLARVAFYVMGIAIVMATITSLSWPVKIAIVAVAFGLRVCIQLFRRRYRGLTADQAPIF